MQNYPGCIISDTYLPISRHPRNIFSKDTIKNIYIKIIDRLFGRYEKGCWNFPEVSARFQKTDAIDDI